MSIKNKLQLRSLERNDREILFQWANDKVTRRNSISQSIINKKEHKQWFAGILKNQTRNTVFICIKGKKTRVGVVRFSCLKNNKKKWEIHFTLAPKHRGKRLAQPMLEKALKKFQQKNLSRAVYAKVFASNWKSLKLLYSLGFKKQRFLKKSSRLVCLRLTAYNE